MKYKLKEIFDLQMGKTPSRNNQSYWNTKDNKWISIADLTKAEKYISKTKEYISERAVDDSGIKIIPANTVVMSFKLSIGKTAITTENMYSNEAIMSFHDKHVVDILPEYIYYLFKYKNWDENSNKAVKGKTLNKATLSEVEIEIYPIEKQRKIVFFLDEIMAIITNKKNELFLLDELVKARFVEMFGTPTKNEKQLPVLNVNDICIKVTDGSHFSPKAVEIGFPMFSVKDMNENGFSYDGCKYISEEDFKILEKQGCIPEENDVLIAKDGSYFAKGFVVKEKKNEGILSSIAMLRPNTKVVNPTFLKYYLLSKEVVDLVTLNYVTGSALKRVILQGIKKIPVILPDIKLQDEFAEFVEQIDKSKFIIQKQIDETQELSNKLMQDYFG